MLKLRVATLFIKEQVTDNNLPRQGNHIGNIFKNAL